MRQGPRAAASRVAETARSPSLDDASTYGYRPDKLRTLGNLGSSRNFFPLRLLTLLGDGFELGKKNNPKMGFRSVLGGDYRDNR